jgi:8-oxo-dGTP diphosphatase
MAPARTSIAIAVVEHDDHFLVGERPPGKPLAGYAEFPGGRVEAGESAEEAAIRECEEETGLKVQVVGSYDDCQHEYPHDSVHLHFFACRPAEADTIPQPPFAWVPRERLAELRFPEANAALLEQLMRGS